MNLLDEIVFWSRQLSEHALFMQLGLTDPKLKTAAATQHAVWEEFRKSLAGLTTDQAGLARDRVIPLAMGLRELKTQVVTAQAGGQWLGWLFPTFIDHTRRELDYFVGKITGQLADPREEVCTWTHFMAEHAAFAAHLLDPQEVQLVAQANGLTDAFVLIGNGCVSSTMSSLLSLGMQAGRELDAYFQLSGIGTARVKSVIHPALADHVVREGARFLQTLGSLPTR